MLEDNKQEQLIVELETLLDTKSKRDYCFEQTKQYKNVSFSNNTKYCILYAEETTQSAKKQIHTFGKTENIEIKTYSLEKVKQLYTETIERLSLNVGLALPNPKNYTICYLRWLNKILKPFFDYNNDELGEQKLFTPFENKSESKTNFNCHKRLALDFEMIIEDNKRYKLTQNGKDYIENMNPNILLTNNVSSIDLTNEQKRLLLKILTNGNWDNKVHKINIYWLMRFIEVTDGEWYPKKQQFDNDKLDIARGLFKVSYKSKTMQQFLNWCVHYCEELGLVGRIVSTTDYDKLFLTPLGVEVNNIFSMDLLLKKSRMNLSFKEL